MITGIIEILIVHEALDQVRKRQIVDSREHFAEASIKTTDNLRTIVQAADVRELSRLSLPEIDAITDLVGQIVPAGNVPGVIVSGLARLPGRRPPSNVVKRDVNLLFRGVEQVLDKAAYGAFFAGPAAVIWGYQNLLKLAGKSPEDSFPEGTWQFYVEYALREDTARHTNETHGFDTALNQHGLTLSPADRMTAWVLTAIRTLGQYDELLANEWRERVHTRLLADMAVNEPDAARYAHLYREWQKQLPYRRGTDATASEPYPVYRRIRFERFLAQAMRDWPADLRQQWETQRAQAEIHDLPAYQQQMSILTYLDPGPYGETRTPIPFDQVHIGDHPPGALLSDPGLPARNRSARRGGYRARPDRRPARLSVERARRPPDPAGGGQTRGAARFAQPDRSGAGR